jgi:DNA-binding SARP family transcriptional activator/tetratricopeptide (TPR) repeat protein
MEFRILGPLEVIENGRAIDVGAAKPRALLAVLLLNANRVVAKDHLIEALWGQRPPGTAHKALQVYVSQLRKNLGRERILTRTPGYELRVEPGELDRHRFEELISEKRLGEALDLWRGTPLAEFAYEPFAQSEIARLDERRIECLEQRIESDLATGRHAPLVGELEALVHEHPLRERLRALLMLALYRSGRQAEALEAYQAARRELAEGLGIEPSRELRELQQAVLRQDSALAAVSSREVAQATEAAPGVFVGRVVELEELRSGLDDAIAGRGRLFLLVGEPGIGKSRLADELIGLARARGALVLVGRCWEADGAPAYWPWVQSLRTLTREVSQDALRSAIGRGGAELAQLLPELADVIRVVGHPDASAPESARFRLFESVAFFLRASAQARPLVLVLDDVHAADEPSLLLLQFLARELADSRMLVVCAYRNIDPTPTASLTEAITDLAREPVTRTLPLRGLESIDVARFVELISGEPASDEFVAALTDETEGNPLFVGEIVRLLAAEGRLEGASTPRLAIPESVRDVIARRLRHLSVECNRVLVLAAVLGREFGLGALAHMGDVSGDALLDTLDEAMAARVVSDAPGSSQRLRFAHVLIRDTIYEGLTTARRVRLHRLAVAASEALYGGEPTQNLAELAYHSIAGSDFGKGLHYAQRAGDRALALLAFEESARLYETALDVVELADPDSETTRCELLLSLGEAQARAGNMPTAKEVFIEAATIARRRHLPRELARAAAGYGGRLMFERASSDVRLVPLLEAGLAALADEDIELRCWLLARLAGALRDEHSRDRRDALSREAIELSRRAEDPVALAYALDGRVSAILAPDTIAECLALASELCRVAEQIGDVERLAHGYMDRCIAELTVGEISASKADLDAAGAIAEKLRQPSQLWQVFAAQAALALAEGRLDEAEELIDKALVLGEPAQSMAIPVHILQRYMLCDFRGSLVQIEPEVRQLVVAHPVRPVLRCVLAHVEVRLGRLSEGKRRLDELAADGFSAVPFDMEWLYGMSLLAETCALLHDIDSASILYQALKPWSAFNVADMWEGVRGAMSRYLGVLASTEWRWDDATAHFEDALAMNERMGAWPWLAYTKCDYAAMLLSRAATGDKRRATALMAEAAHTAQDLGLNGLSSLLAALDPSRSLDASPSNRV